ncbi:hypothetical protein [Streptomyces sp. NPDC096153]|uniref:hypothetical protein n=1 Tax=Streptomyces sp. NPDC096153 TaxID=3155548 RepID=UPI00331C8125
MTLLFAGPQTRTEAVAGAVRCYLPELPFFPLCGGGVVKEKAVSVELTGEGYVVTCEGADVVGRGPTEAEAWIDFWEAVRAEWRPPQDVTIPATPSGRLPARLARWQRVRTIRVRNLFG